MGIFPFIQPNVVADKVELPIYKEVKWDFISDTPVFKNGNPVIVEGNEAVKVWIWNALKTVRRRFKIFTWNYGNDVEDLIGQPYSEELKQSEAKRYIEECLLINPYIKTINDIEISFSGDKLTINFSVETIYGSVNIGGFDIV